MKFHYVQSHWCSNALRLVIGFYSKPLCTEGLVPKMGLEPIRYYYQRIFLLLYVTIALIYCVGCSAIDNYQLFTFKQRHRLLYQQNIKL